MKKNILYKGISFYSLIIGLFLMFFEVNHQLKFKYYIIFCFISFLIFMSLFRQYDVYHFNEIKKSIYWYEIKK